MWWSHLLDCSADIQAQSLAHQDYGRPCVCEGQPTLAAAEERPADDSTEQMEQLHKIRRQAVLGPLHSLH
jgi:hypothetical protein